jgi:hypothetical protein
MIYCLPGPEENHSVFVYNEYNKKGAMVGKELSRRVATRFGREVSKDYRYPLFNHGIRE